MLTELEQKWRDLCDRWATEGYNSLSDTDRIWLNTRDLIDSVDGGGLISFFYNGGADNYADCREALMRLGAARIAAQVQRVADLFGTPVPADIQRRNDIINSWPDDGSMDSLLEEVDDALSPQMRILEGLLDSFLVEQGVVSASQAAAQQADEADDRPQS